MLRPGDWVQFDGGEHQVVALAGTSVRLRSSEGAESVVLASYLMASPGFGLVDGAPLPAMEPLGLLEGLPEDVLAAAKLWQRHVVEVETGLPPEAGPEVEPRPDLQADRPVGHRTAHLRLGGRRPTGLPDRSRRRWRHGQASRCRSTDSTPIDVMVLADTGLPVRADLTIAVDVATRTICAAVLRPVGTKAIDAALLLARTLVPEPMRPPASAARP